MIKIYTISYREDKPYIRISGNHLKRFGFNIGDKMAVLFEKNKIQLTLLKNQDLILRDEKRPGKIS